MRNGRWAWIRIQADKPNGLTTADMMREYNITQPAAWETIKRYKADSKNPLFAAKWAREINKHYFNTQQQAEAFMARDPALTCKPIDGAIRIVYRGTKVEIPRAYARELLTQLQESLCE